MNTSKPHSDIVFYYPSGHEAHFEHGHPERPGRVETIRDSLQAAGLWDGYPKLEPILPPEEILASIHDDSYIVTLKSLSERGMHLDADTYTTPASWRLASNAAGGAIMTAVAVWREDSKRGFALCRPPGHHATQNAGMGFCLLNNIALAAEYLLQKESAQQLAIIDLDLHHGNGTQDIFWERSDVFYLSTHQSPLYPGTGSLDETGIGPGKGKTANFPLPPGTGDEGFLEIMDSLIIPIIDGFKPEMILVSFGFDPHWLDPLGHLQLSARGYGELIHRLASWADTNCSGKLALFLEGGYDLDAGAACAQAVTAAMLDMPWEDPLGRSPRTEGTSWKVVARRAREIWGL